MTGRVNLRDIVSHDRVKQPPQEALFRLKAKFAQQDAQANRPSSNDKPREATT